jgi:hypothetical protein
MRLVDATHVGGVSRACALMYAPLLMFVLRRTSQARFRATDVAPLSIDTYGRTRRERERERGER